ncbi:MAG: GIY-YIG nuclease family protein [Bacteroidota bacterium]
MATVYVIRSKEGYRYIGSTTNFSHRLFYAKLFSAHFQRAFSGG